MTNENTYTHASYAHTHTLTDNKFTQAMTHKSAKHIEYKNCITIIVLYNWKRAIASNESGKKFKQNTDKLIVFNTKGTIIMIHVYVETYA